MPKEIESYMIGSIDEVEQEPCANDQTSEHEQSRETSEENRGLFTANIGDLRRR